VPQFPPTLDRQVAELLDAASASGASPLVRCTPAEARARVTAGAALCAPGPELRDVRNVEIPLQGGHIGARRYRPDDAEPRATVVYLHGGGWVTGDLEYSDPLCRHLAADAGCEVLAVDYRLAPEHPFPTPLEDAYGALCWAADELASGRPLVVAGDSAGGALAAACAQRARDEAGPELAGQLLVYPVLDADFSRNSYAENRGMVLGPEEMGWFWDHYLPDPHERAHPWAAPLRAQDLSGLPATVLVVADLDPLRDEGLAYAARLAECGVPVRLRHVPGLVHGFLRFTARVDAAAAEAHSIAADLRDLLARTPIHHPRNEATE
jgi:acetyl esterase